MRVVTCNMQGGNASTENKWQTGVMNMFTQLQLDAMCVQEAGAPPASANLVNTVNIPKPGGGVEVVQVYVWGGTTSRPFGFIVFHNWDTQGNRVNTAIVIKGSTAPTAANIVLCWPAAGATWRPALGVLANNTFLFSFHAISPGGPDGAAMLTAIATAAGSNSWYVGADWNRLPGQLAVPANSVVCPPNGNTYPATRPTAAYDYFVRNGASQVIGSVVTTLILSDHLPVAYAF